MQEVGVAVAARWSVSRIGMAGVAVALLASGCAKPTAQEMVTAEAAVVESGLSAAGVEKLALDDYWLPEDERVAFEEVLITAVQLCMSEAGFDVGPQYDVKAEPEGVALAKRWGVLSEDRAATLAYYPTQEELQMGNTPHRALPIMLDAIGGDSNQAAFTALLGDEEGKDQGCYGRSMNTLADVTDVRGYHESMTQLGQLVMTADGQAVDSEPVKQAVTAWRDCMVAKGHEKADTPWLAPSLVIEADPDAKGTKPGETVPTKAGKTAAGIAQDDVACKQESNFVSVFAAELVAAHQEVASKNKELLDGIQAIHNQILAEG